MIQGSTEENIVLINIYPHNTKPPKYIKQILTNVAKLILGIIVFTTPIISIIFSGTILGIILIFVGVAIIISCVKTTNTYKVKIK